MGSDLLRTQRPIVFECFNSRSRMGSDSLPHMSLGIASSFNSRSRMGSDAGTLSRMHFH